MTDKTQQSLTGLRVLDLTRFLAGPICTMILGDMGAEVIKIESIPGGDDLRSIGPFLNDESAGFLSLNRNKKSLCLNLSNQEGKELFCRLVERFDVVAENFRPGVMEKLGLDYNTLKKINPRLVYVAVSGFGQNGPYSHKPAFDFIIAGYSGLLNISTPPGEEPIRIGVGICDILGGLFGTIGVLCALKHREISGEGMMVDVGMLDSAVLLMENPIARYFATGQIPQPSGSQHPFVTPMGLFRVKNGYITLAVGNQVLWRTFCKRIGREDLIEDPEFATNADRTRNRDKLNPILSDVFQTRTSQEWLRIMDESGIPCGPVNNVEEMVKDEQVLFRNMILDIEHPKAGRIKAAGNPIKLSGMENKRVEHPPLLGQHTDEILRVYLGLTAREVGKLRREGVVA